MTKNSNQVGPAFTADQLREPLPLKALFPVCPVLAELVFLTERKKERERQQTKGEVTVYILKIMERQQKPKESLSERVTETALPNTAGRTIIITFAQLSNVKRSGNSSAVHVKLNQHRNQHHWL